jgi:hypothetical protein
MFLWNIDTYLPDYTASHPRRCIFVAIFVRTSNLILIVCLRRSAQWNNDMSAICTLFSFPTGEKKSALFACGLFANIVYWWCVCRCVPFLTALVGSWWSWTAQFENPLSSKHEILYPGSCLILEWSVSFVEGQTSLLEAAKESWVWRQH